MFNGCCVNTVAHLGGSAVILEEVAQVLLALAAQQLHPLAAIGIQLPVLHMLPYLSPKAGEAGAYIKFILCLEQHLPAVRAGIDSGFLLLLPYLAPVPEHGSES